MTSSITDLIMKKYPSIIYLQMIRTARNNLIITAHIGTQEDYVISSCIAIGNVPADKMNPVLLHAIDVLVLQADNANLQKSPPCAGIDDNDDNLA